MRVMVVAMVIAVGCGSEREPIAKTDDAESDRVGKDAPVKQTCAEADAPTLADAVKRCAAVYIQTYGRCDEWLLREGGRSMQYPELDGAQMRITSFTISLSAAGRPGLALFGPNEIRRDWLGRMVSESKVMCFSTYDVVVNEPGVFEVTSTDPDPLSGERMPGIWYTDHAHCQRDLSPRSGGQLGCH